MRLLESVKKLIKELNAYSTETPELLMNPSRSEILKSLYENKTLRFVIDKNHNYYTASANNYDHKMIKNHFSLPYRNREDTVDGFITQGNLLKPLKMLSEDYAVFYGWKSVSSDFDNIPRDSNYLYATSELNEKVLNFVLDNFKKEPLCRTLGFEVVWF